MGKPFDQPFTPTVQEAEVCTIECHHSCQTCSGPAESDCIKCYSGFFMSAPGVCSMCPFGTGKPADEDVPQITTSEESCTVKCHSTCRTCHSPNSQSCVNCRAGYYFQFGECTKCPAGYGKPEDTISRKVNQQQSDCSAICHPSCQMCAGDKEEDCTNCNPGYWWSSPTRTGRCISCPRTRGKVPIPICSPLLPALQKIPAKPTVISAPVDVLHVESLPQNACRASKASSSTKKRSAPTVR